MKRIIPLLVGALVIYLVFFRGSDKGPSQADIQSLESIKDENGTLVEVPILEKDGLPYPQISHGFKKLGLNKLPKPLNNLKDLLPTGPSVLPIVRSGFGSGPGVSGGLGSLTKKRQYIPDYYRKDTMPMNNIGSEEMRPFVTDEEAPEDSWTDENVSTHPKFYNASMKDDELTNIGSFFDKNNQYNDTTSPNTFPLPSDNCYVDKDGGTFCLDNTRLQVVPPALITDPQNCYALNPVGMYKDYDTISDNTQRVSNGGVFYGQVEGSRDLGHNETFGTPLQDTVGSCQI